LRIIIICQNKYSCTQISGNMESN